MEYYAMYNPNNIRAYAHELARKYSNLKESHVYWVAKELNIYPDGVPSKKGKNVVESKTGKINKDNVEYVTNGRINDNGKKAIESYLEKEGYKVREHSESNPSVNVWEQIDLISMMKKDYEKTVAERDSAKAEADQYCRMADEYEKEIEELKDKLLIAEKENNELIQEKKELSKMQIKPIDFNREIESLQVRIGKYNSEINMYSSEVNELRKNVAALQTSVNRLQDQKKKLEAVISDLIGCSKRLMNLK